MTFRSYLRGLSQRFIHDAPPGLVSLMLRVSGTMSTPTTATIRIWDDGTCLVKVSSGQDDNEGNSVVTSWIGKGRSLRDAIHAAGRNKPIRFVHPAPFRVLGHPEELDIELED
jgi:hypothetical protein